jgi:hypothetical protein
MNNNYYSQAITNYDARLMTIRRARRDPAFRKGLLRKRAAKNFVGNVVGVVLLIALIITVASLALGFVAVAAVCLTLYVVYRVVVRVLAGIARSVCGAR